MPDYGVDEAGWSPLPWSWAGDKLRAGRNFWMVTVAASGRPHALPVWGVWESTEQRFAFSCGPRSRKVADLAANPQAVIAVDDTVECVSVEGRAVAVTDADRRDRWIERYLAKYRPMAPDLDAEFLRANVMIEFSPDRAFGVIERADEFATRATRWRFSAPQPARRTVEP